MRKMNVRGVKKKTQDPITKKQVYYNPNQRSIPLRYAAPKYRGKKYLVKINHVCTSESKKVPRQSVIDPPQRWAQIRETGLYDGADSGCLGDIQAECLYDTEITGQNLSKLEQVCLNDAATK